MPLFGRERGSRLTQCGLRRVLPPSKFHLDPSNRLTTIHQRYRPRDRTDRTTVRQYMANRFTNARPTSSSGCLPRSFAVGWSSAVTSRDVSESEYQLLSHSTPRLPSDTVTRGTSPVSTRRRPVGTVPSPSGSPGMHLSSVRHRSLAGRRFTHSRHVDRHKQRDNGIIRRRKTNSSNKQSYRVTRKRRAVGRRVEEAIDISATRL